MNLSLLVTICAVLLANEFNSVLVSGRAGDKRKAWAHGVSLNARSDVPGFHYLLRNSPNMMEYIFENQLWKGSVVSNGVFHTYQHPGGKVERGFEEVLQEAVKQYDSWTFPQDVNAYWTFQIRLARRNSDSKWHSYAKTLPVGIQTIKIRKPKNWMGTLVTKWNDVKEVKVIIY